MVAEQGHCYTVLDANTHKTKYLDIDQVLTLLALTRVVLSVLVALLLVDIGTTSTPLVVLIENLGWDTVEELLGVDAEQRPCQIEGLVDGARFISTLGDKGTLELFEKFKRQLVF